jgi:hypothetical protein
VTDQRKTLRTALKTDEGSQHSQLLIFLFCALVNDRATSLEVFNIINHVLEDNEID